MAWKETMSALAQPQLSRRDLVAPVQLVYSYEPTEHPRGQSLAHRVSALMERLHRIASQKLEPRWTPHSSEDDATTARETWLSLLEAARAAHEALSGVGMRVLLRDVRKINPALASSLEDAAKSALDTLSERRAFIAVIIDADDDEELGIEVIPSMGDVQPGPSVPC